MSHRLTVIILIGMIFFNISCNAVNLNPQKEDKPKIGWYTGWVKYQTNVGKVTRIFQSYLPKNLPKNPPVVILLYGGKRSMHEIFNKNAGGTKAWPDVADEEKFLLIVPNGTGIRDGSPTGNNQQWNDCRPIGSTANDVRFISELIALADKEVGINNNRVYVTGVSNGGLMAYRLARELDSKIAAVAAFIANIPKNSQCSSPANSVPVMIVNGTEDPIMPYYGGKVSKGGRGKVLSTKATVQFWANQYDVPAQPAAKFMLPNRTQDDHSRVARFRYGSKKLDAPVVLYKVIGGGHAMPSIKYEIPHIVERTLLDHQNNDVEGARIAWRFLSQHVK